MKKKFLLILIVIVIVILVSSILVISGVKRRGNIVARYITGEHYRYSPVKLNGEIYFPVGNEAKEIKGLKSIGHLSGKDKGFFNDIFLDAGAILVEDNNYRHFTVVDDFPMSYSNIEYLQDPNLIKSNMNKYNNFVLCNDKNEVETRITIEKELLNKFQEKFGVTKYNIEDFNNCDDIYYIYVDCPKEKIHERTFDNPIIYLGCIFVKDGKLYYENLTNEIKGDLQDKLKVYIK